MNVGKKLLQISGLWLLLAGIASAAIVGVIIALFVTIGGYGTYQPAPDMGFTAIDADTTDAIDFKYDQASQVITFNFPVWTNKTGVEYRNVLSFTPKSDGQLILSEMQISPGNMKSVRVQLTDKNDEYTYPWSVPAFPNHISIPYTVTAGKQYNFSFMVDTGSDDTQPEMITFGAKKE